MESLPWPILAILLVGFFVTIMYALSKASQFKAYAQDFPTQSAPVVVAIVLALLTAPVALSRMALGMGQPDGSGDWLAFLAAMAGVSVVGLGVKRFSAPEYTEAKAKGKSIAAATVAAAGASGVNVEGNANITSERAAVQPVAVASADPRLPSPLDDERADA